jgi:excisionase family DNA binding protein
MPRPARLTSDEIDLAFRDEESRADFPPILTIKQFAKLFGVSQSTTYTWIAQGRLTGCVTRIGKHNRIWRNRVIEQMFNRGLPRSESKLNQQEGNTP